MCVFVCVCACVCVCERERASECIYPYMMILPSTTLHFITSNLQTCSLHEHLLALRRLLLIFKEKLCFRKLQCPAMLSHVFPTVHTHQFSTLKDVAEIKAIPPRKDLLIGL